MEPAPSTEREVCRDRAALEGHQLERLNALLEALRPANAFYTRKLADAGVPARCGTLGEYARFPFTRKAELVADQHAAPPYGTNLTFPLERYVRCHQTSGTTGQPLRWLDTAESWDWMVRSWMDIFEAAGVRRGDRALFAFSFGPFIGFWLAFEAAERLGVLCVPGGGLGSPTRLRILIEHGITVLCCTPSYAQRLGEVAVEQQTDLARGRVRLVVVAGEPGGSIPATRAAIGRIWRGARVFDHHGMTEVGPVTFECPAQPGVLHVLERAYLPEIVDPATGEAVVPGTTGELILTPLGRTGSPLLRYRTGDLVQAVVRPPGTPCACGRVDVGLAGGILGRADDMVIVRGVNVFPSAVEEVIRRQRGIREYQVRVTRRGAMAELAVQIEPEPEPMAEGLAARLADEFQAVFALRIPVTLVPQGTLPRFEMKARRWLREEAG